MNELRAFFGRDDLCQSGLDYFLDNKEAKFPLIIHGKSGYGKTSLVSKIAVLAQSKLLSLNKSPLLVVRFCGTSAQSSTSRALMESICQHICRARKVHYEKSNKYADLIKKFHDALQQGSADKPLLVFIDSLDQLTDEDLGRSNLKWIPETLPVNCYLVVSTLPDIGGSFKYFNDQTSIPDTNYLEVSMMTKSDGGIIISEWLKHRNRTLQPEQLEYLINLGTTKQPDIYCPRETHILTPLKLKLLLDIVVQWKSYETIDQLSSIMDIYLEKGNDYGERRYVGATQKLTHLSYEEREDYEQNGCKVMVDCTSINSLITGFFRMLEARHGSELIAYFCGLLSVCKGGLSESHMSDMLSCASPVMDAVLQYHSPPIRRLPQIVMARLRNDISSYIVERGLYDSTILSWFHRQFIENAKRLYLPTSELTPAELPELRIRYCTLIAEYFSNELHDKFPEIGLEQQVFYWKDTQSKTTKFNHVSLLELPHALHGLAFARKWVSLTCNLHFIALCSASGVSRDLIENFHLWKTKSRGFFNSTNRALSTQWERDLNMMRHSIFGSDKTPEFYPIVEGYSYFLSSNVAILHEYPYLVHQLAMNMPDDHIVFKDAQTQKLVDILPWAADEIAGLNLYNHVTKVQSESPCLHTLTDDSDDDITRIRINKEAKVIVSGNCKGKVIIWGLKNGLALYTLNVGKSVCQIVTYNEFDIPDRFAFSMAVSTVTGAIHVFWVNVAGSDIQVETGLVWQAHSVPNGQDTDEFANVPIAISAEYNRPMRLITSAAKSVTLDDLDRGLDVNGEFSVWEMGKTSDQFSIFPTKIEKLTTIKGGSLLGEKDIFENFPLVAVFPSENIACIAVEQAQIDHQNANHVINGRIVVCQVNPFEKLIVSEEFEHCPTSLSMYNCVRHDQHGWRIALTFERQHMFQIMEFHTETNLGGTTFKSKGEIIFQSKEHKTKELKKLVFIDCNHVIFNLGAGLVNLNLDSKKYKFNETLPPAFFPGHPYPINGLTRSNNLDNDNGLIFSADCSSIKVMNMKKLLEFQRKPINNR